jgi:hypothetical protein
MVRMTTALLFLCLIGESQAGDKPRMARGPHLLHTTFHETDPRWNFNHDVHVRSKGGQFTLIVLDDPDKKHEEAAEADEAASKPVQGGLGSPSEDGTAKSSAHPAGQKPLLAAKRKLHGSVDTEGVIKFGVTTIHDGELVSLHFVGAAPKITGPE